MEHCPADEVVIITNLVDSILAHDDLAICVRDEEAVSMKTTRDRAKILSVVGDTEITIFKIKKLSDLSKEIKKGNVSDLGFITLIHGNGEHVISDFSESVKHLI
ncbi:hypothetical protein [Providencia alcalifaciens]|uniref:hypothetical protein n=1 Tax=Providencia alcalifaciens TaxID=126385 RepID=UPI002B059D2D|nr:hypothetical protein [Providencia alcalifaciens]